MLISKELYKKVLMIIFFVSNIIAPTILHGQQYSFNHLSVDEGLQNNVVFSITQDKEGFMWFATLTGIERYDGNNFKHFKVPNYYRKADEFAQVNFISNDIKNRLWATSNNSLLKYNPNTESFEIVDIINQYLKNYQVISALFIDSNGNVWLGLSNTLLVYNPKLNKVYSSKQIKSFVRAFYEDSDGSIWVGTAKGVINVLLKDEITILKPDQNPIYRIKEAISFIDRDRNERLWIGSLEKGLWVVDDINNRIKILNIPKSSGRAFTVKDIYHDDFKGIHYVSLDGGGLLLINQNLDIITNIKSDEDRPKSLSNNGLYDIYVDMFKRMWISTYGSGINYTNTELQPFVNFTHEVNNNASLANNMGRCVVEDNKGKLWFGTRKGLSIYHPNTKIWNKISTSDKLSSDNILAIFAGKNNNIWAGTYGGGLLKISADNFKTTVYRRNEQLVNSIGTDYIYTVLEDKNGNVWTGGIRGNISLFNPKTEKFYKVPISANSINRIFQSSSKKVYVGTEKGLFIIDYHMNNNQEPKFSSILHLSKFERVLTISEPYSGKIYIGTQGLGVQIIDLNNKKIGEISSKNGLPSDIIAGIISDRRGDLWISTFSGIAHLIAQDKVITYTKADGLAGTQFNVSALCSTANGDLIFGSTDGFSKFNPSHILNVAHQPILALTKLKIDNNEIKNDGITEIMNLPLNQTSSIKLKYNQNNFSIEFANLAPNTTGRHIYSFFLKGVDKKWTTMTSANSAAYSNIPPGEYEFYIKAFSKGKQREASRKLTILITPPWWKTNIAYIIYIVLLSALGYGIRNYYLIRKARKLYAERLKLQINIAHEIRTPLSLIKGPISILEKHQHYSEEDRRNILLAKQNVIKLENTIDQFIDYQKAGLNKMLLKVGTYNFIKVCDDLVSYFQPLFNEKHIHLNYKKNQDIIKLPFDKEKIEKLLSNLITNAIKYTPVDGEVTITVAAREFDVEFNIKDNGIGIPKVEQKYIFNGYYRADNTVNHKEKGTGIGLSIAKEMADLHHGKLYFTSSENEGTCFKLRLPINNPEISAFIINREENEENKESKYHNNKSEGKRILVVEDTDDLRLFLCDELKNSGYLVHEAQDGIAAIELLKKINVDIIITDVMMPRMNGFQLCKEIRKNLQISHLPIIILTAIHDKEYLLEGYKAGADDYVKKPFDLTYIKTRIEGLLTNRIIFKNRILSVFDHDELPQEDQDIKWLKEATSLITDHLADPNFSVEKLCDMMAMSRPVLFRKFKAITGNSPQTTINQIRMRKAAELLKSKKHNINEVAYLTGFSEPKYFSTTFKKHFNQSPKEYLSENDI